MVSPLDRLCEARFSFDIDGKVRPAVAADRGVQETIARLELDCARLRALLHGED
jgi:hypothetical protein